MEQLFYSISEVAKILDVKVSCVRYWTDSFPNLVKPLRNQKGNRQYTKLDIEALKQVQHLVKNGGLTIEGAGRVLVTERSKVDKSVKVLESLKSIRERLIEVRNVL